MKCLKVDAACKTSSFEATKTIRPCRQSMFSLAYFELGRRWQLMAAGLKWRRISWVTGTLFLYSRAGFPTWDVQRGETIFHGSIIQKPVFILHLTHMPHVPVLPATPCSLSTETLVQKLLVYMKHFLIRLEIDTFSSYKLDGDDRLLTILLEHRSINIGLFWMRETHAPCSIKERVQTCISKQHAKRSYSPFPKPSSSFP